VQTGQEIVQAENGVPTCVQPPHVLRETACGQHVAAGALIFSRKRVVEQNDRSASQPLPALAIFNGVLYAAPVGIGGEPTPLCAGPIEHIGREIGRQHKPPDDNVHCPTLTEGSELQFPQWDGIPHVCPNVGCASVLGGRQRSHFGYGLLMIEFET
jgi:hypothetical protein